MRPNHNTHTDTQQYHMTVQHMMYMYMRICMMNMYVMFTYVFVLEVESFVAAGALPSNLAELAAEQVPQQQCV